MTILHVMPNVSRAFGGPTESLIGYAQAARTQGMDVHVAAPSVSAEDEAWLREQLPEATLHFFASAGQHAYVVAPGLWIWMWQEAKRFDAAHVHGLFNPVSSLSAWIGIVRGVPTVMRPFGTLSRYTFSRRSALKRLYFTLLDRPALRRAAAIHFTTEAERDEANRLSINFEDRSAVVPPPWRGETITADMDKKADRPTVLYMSRLHPKKNVQGLLRAWAQVVADRPDAQLWVAGDGDDDYVQRLRDTVATHGLGELVSFLGFVSGDEKERVLREAWAFALPSHQENFGVAVLEAVAAGLPVVISGEVQLRSFVEEKDLGRIVDRTDPSAIATGLSTVLADDAGRRRVAEDGPRAVEETFSVDRVGGELRDLYESVIHNRECTGAVDEPLST
ncbi:glycosyltransferase [Salinibacter ruber]|uniref:glycosyltransferase n=1 Tax=Salinibacter ruber TaxID=146919 RepID=UPI00216A6491|nr:glycosyltransferase [Salinibacter ruber]MCS4199759.1 glycosyltransferase involved in cell wall biosynthesis [Salinibacter ruber]